VSTPQRTHSTSSALDASSPRGSVEPRLWTPPLVELGPATSYGYGVCDFARDVLGQPLDPWEEWAAIHLGELLPDGRPRFRTCLVIVARQNGKTLLAKTLILYWLFVERVGLVLGTSTDRTYAKRTWFQVVEQARENRWLAEYIRRGSPTLQTGEESLKTTDGSEYTFAANNRRAARSTTLDRWICDELREHASWDAWNAATNAMNARPDAQVVAITNQGDDSSIVLDSLRDTALEYLETGIGDRRLGLLEWSSPDGSDPTDLGALAYANPNLGHRIDPDALLGAAVRAKRAGGIELASFRTEVMCQRVHHMDSAIDPDLWAAAGTATPLDLGQHRERVALGLDVSLDGSHATLAAAAVVDGTVHVEILAGWDSTRELREQLPAIVARVRPRAVGWLPAGPAAAILPDLMERRRGGWPPRRVQLEELRSEATAVCMSFSERVTSGQLRHGRDPLMDAHVANAQRLHRGDGWVFQRRGAGPVDGLYAASVAAFLARTLPAPRPALKAL